MRIRSHNRDMARRSHVPLLQRGTIDLPPAEAHHVRDVLRMKTGDVLQLFDDAGTIADGTIVRSDRNGVSVRVETVTVRENRISLTVAAAVPKGDRADWMIEKLSELGVSRLIPLRTARSVVHPQGAGKLDRWKRIATEAAKQSRRSGVMSIEPLANLHDVVSAVSRAIYLSPVATNSLARIEQIEELTLFIGPEGGWTDDEIQAFESRNFTPARLTTSVLRIETAAVLAAGIVLSR